MDLSANFQDILDIAKGVKKPDFGQRFVKCSGWSHNFGDRYMKFGDGLVDYDLKKGETYVGEYSWETNKPHGRGIKINADETISIDCWNNGKKADTGKYIEIYFNGYF